MSNMLSFSDWSKYNSLNESIKDAKGYLEKRAASQEANKLESTATQDKQDYEEILNLIGSNHGYAYPFILFHFEHNVPITSDPVLINDGQETANDENEDNLGISVEYSLRGLFNLLKDNAGSLNKLQDANENKMSVMAYSKMPSDTEPTPFKQLMDQLINFEQIKQSAKYFKDCRWIVEQVNTELRKSIKDTLSHNQLINLYRAAKIINLIDDEYKDIVSLDADGNRTNCKITFLAKTNRYNEAIAYLDWAVEYSKTLNNSDLKAILNNLAIANRNQPNSANIIYNSDGYLAVTVRTEAAQKQAFMMASWCINNGSWNSYGGMDNGTQFNIFNLNKPLTDIYYVTGTTITLNADNNYYVYASHAKNDDNILSSKNPMEHFKKLDYPEDLLKSLETMIPLELPLKRLMLSGSNPTVASKILTDIIKSNLSINLNSTYIDKIFNPIKEILNTSQMVEAFKNVGITSTGTAKLLMLLIPDLDDESKQDLIGVNLKVVEAAKRIIEKMGRDYNEKLTTFVDSSNVDEIRSILFNKEPSSVS